MARNSAEKRTLLRLAGRYFVNGLIIVAPVAVTGYVLYKVFQIMDAPIQAQIVKVLGHPLPGVGFLLMVTLATLLLIAVGALSANVLGRGLVDAVDRRMQRVPLVKLVYTSIKDMVDAFAGKNNRFNQPVTLRFGAGGVRMIGFVTRGTMDVWGMRDQVAVYVPQAYSFAGFVLLSPRELVEPLAAPVGEVMTFAISGGLAGPEEAPADAQGAARTPAMARRTDAQTH